MTLASALAQCFSLALQQVVNEHLKSIHYYIILPIKGPRFRSGVSNTWPAKEFCAARDGFWEFSNN